MKDLSARIAALPPEHRVLFEQRLRHKGLAPVSIQSIPRRSAVNLCPLTIDQERLWFIDHLQPDTPAYNISSATRLEGRLDISLLQKSMNELVRRHEILRTTFPSTDGVPRQFIAQSLVINIPLIDLRRESQPESKLQMLMTRKTQEPFHLAEGPLLRLNLFQLKQDEHALLVTMHHTITDRWSFTIFWRELSVIYRGLCLGTSATLPELPIQFADYSVWQREMLQGEACGRQLSYWKKQLAGAPFVLDLPTDYSRPPVLGMRGKREFWNPPKKLWDQLKQFNQRHDVTMFMTVLAAYNILLYRYTGQESINVGSPFANRDRIETEGLIGFLLNMLMLRSDLSGNPTVLELLGRVREVALGAYAHSELPFGLLVPELMAERDMSRNPLYQVAFVLVDMQDSVWEVPGLKMTSLEVESGMARLDLMLGLRDGSENPTILFEYNTDLFAAATITRMLRHLEVLLEATIDGPHQRIADISILGDDECRQLVSEFKPTKTAGGAPGKCLHELFGEQAKRSPNIPAVVDGEKQLSYRELNEAAEQVALSLRRLGVGVETPVGICMERSVEMVMALLGILKAGAACVPLDPTFPRERLAYMMDQARVEALLAQDALLEMLPRHCSKVLTPETSWQVISNGPEPRPAPLVQPANLAYIIFTSGSTGRPKGVLCTHQGVVNLLADFTRRNWIAEGMRCSFWTSLSFDVSFYEIFSALLAGGTLHIVPEAVRADSSSLIEWLCENEIACSYIPPFMLRDVANWLSDKTNTLALRRLLVGVEPIPGHVLDLIMARLPDLCIINGYGPTEAGICSTLYSLPTHMMGNGNVPIGQPVQNTEVFLLSERQQLVPLGVRGEIYVGGAGLARGYQHHPDSTAEHFLPHAFSSEPGARLYRTGDQARWLANGELEFIGRFDQQIKLRGYRIELSEIEAVLSEHVGVRKAVVTTNENAGDGKTLIAYIVPRLGQSLEFKDLRIWLRERLPAYMVPPVFVQLDELPLSPNGKIDRQALPSPETTHAEYVPPRNATEELLADLWAEVLRVDSISIHDNFFALGGHSLLATRLLSRMRDVFQVDVPLRAVFEATTVEEMALLVEDLLFEEVAAMNEEQVSN